MSDHEDQGVLTETELSVWLAAFAARQPQPSNHSSAVYWAAAAVGVLRGYDQKMVRCEAMFEFVKKRFRSTGAEPPVARSATDESKEGTNELAERAFEHARSVVRRDYPHIAVLPLQPRDMPLWEVATRFAYDEGSRSFANEALLVFSTNPEEYIDAPLEALHGVRRSLRAANERIRELEQERDELKERHGEVRDEALALYEALKTTKEEAEARVAAFVTECIAASDEYKAALKARQNGDRAGYRLTDRVNTAVDNLPEEHRPK